ncbi:peritrophin-44-like [Haliotis asinina]|uniref:peritrophin-44-like n=1 Tax=Haliotis asinina TaxID=109174 RepID=UPI003532759F
MRAVLAVTVIIGVVAPPSYGQISSTSAVFTGAGSAVCGPADSHFTSDPSECSTFTREVGGAVREYRCAAGMVYNADISMCDWPANSPICQDPSENPPLYATDPTECLMACPQTNDVVYPLFSATQIKCGEYYVCQGGQLFIGNCSDIGSGEFPFFDSTTRSCVSELETININCPPGSA